MWEKGGGRGVLGKPPLPQSPLPMLCWIYPIYGKREGEGVRGWILSDVCSVLCGYGRRVHINTFPTLSAFPIQREGGEGG